MSAPRVKQNPRVFTQPRGLWKEKKSGKQALRAAGYIRESDERLATGTTIESQAKAVREYCLRQGYIYPEDLEFREAISAYLVPLPQREQIVALLEAASQG